MANAWFRLYSEFADDPKVQMLPEVMQRRLVMLMCSKCKGETLHETQRAFQWRVSPADVQATKQAFVENGFIDEHWNLLNWNKRQFLSDSSTDRVRRHRDGLKQDETLLKQNETLLKRPDAVTVTPTEQNRTDTEAEQKHKKPLARSAPSKSDPVRAIYLAYSKHRHVEPRDAVKAINAAIKRLQAGEEDEPPMDKQSAELFLLRKTMEYAQTPAGNNGSYTPHPATWFNKARYFDDPETWQHIGGNGNGNGNGISKSERNQQLTIDGLKRSYEELGVDPHSLSKDRAELLGNGKPGAPTLNGNVHLRPADPTDPGSHRSVVERR